MSTRSAALALIAAVSLALAGCSAGGAPPAKPSAAQPGGPGQPAGAASPQNVAWVNQLCGAVQNFAAAEKKAPPANETSADAFKQSSITEIDFMKGAANDTIGQLQHVGPSPITGGDRVASNFIQGFGQVRDALASARTKAEQVDTSNKQAFTSGMGGVQDDLKKGLGGLTLDQQFAEFDRNPALNAAAAQAPACKALASAASTPPPSTPHS